MDCCLSALLTALTTPDMLQALPGCRAAHLFSQCLLVNLKQQLVIQVPANILPRLPQHRVCVMRLPVCLTTGGQVTAASICICQATACKSNSNSNSRHTRSGAGTVCKQLLASPKSPYP